MTLRAIDGGARTTGTPGVMLSAYDAEDQILANAMSLPDILIAARPILRPEHFRSDRSRGLWETICKVFDAGIPLSIPAIMHALKEDKRLQEWNAPDSLFALVERTGAIRPRTAEHLAKVVRDTWARRELAYQAARVKARAENDGATIDTQLIEARAEIDRVLVEISRDSRVADAETVMREAVAKAEAATHTGASGRLTGFAAVDNITAGLHVELTILGARPGMGKTSLATQIALNVAARGELAFIASLETTKDVLGLRMICSEAQVEFKRMQKGLLTPAEWSRFNEAAQRLSKLPFVLDDSKGVSIAELWSHARRQQAISGKKLGLVMIDYLQLVRGPRKDMKREEIVSENARACIAMAQDLNCPVLALAQLNRETEKREGHRPGLADLRESGEIEQAARCIMFLYRKDYYRRKKEQRDGIAEVIVAKQNNGPTESAFLHFEAFCARFDSLMITEEQQQHNQGAFDDGQD